MAGYDVFVSYNRSDADDAQQFVQALSSEDLTVFFDREDLLPGGEWRGELEDAVKTSRAVAVLLGRNGLGRTQEKEEKLALAEQERRDLLLFRVLLPGTDPPKEATLGGLNTYVDLSAGINNSSELGRLKLALEKTALKQRGERKDLPDPSTAPPSSALEDIENAVQALVRRFGESETSMTFFVGSGVSFPPSPMDMALRITECLRKNDRDFPAVSSLDLAGTYFAVDTDDDLAVEMEVQSLLRASSGKFNATTHEALAKIAALLQTKALETEKRDAERAASAGLLQGVRKPPRVLLLVTTNFDVNLERALLRQGVTFKRIVQFTSEPRLDVTNFTPTLQGNSIVIQVTDSQSTPIAAPVVLKDNWAALDDAIATPTEAITFRPGSRAKQSKNPLRTLPLVAKDARPGFHVVLYKAYGSLDRSGSCVISCDHHYRFALKSIPEGLIPAEIVEMIQNTSIVFLGYNLFDSVYRLVHHTLLSSRIQTDKARMYVVRPRPALTDPSEANRVEASLWMDVKRSWSRKGATLVEVSESDFLERLYKRLN